MRRNHYPLFLLFILCFVPFVYAETVILNVSPSNVELEVWKGFNNDGEGNASFVQGKFNLSISDATGGWALAKICRGIMPHRWGVRYALLDSEVEIEKSDFADIILDIDLKLVEYQNYTNDNSTVNVSFTMFFDGYVEDYQTKCYQTEIQLFSFVKDGVKKDESWFFTSPFEDYVAQFKLADNLQTGVLKHYSLNLMPYIEQMMDHYGLSHVKLKHVEIFTEAYKGYCNFEVYNAKITYTPKSNCNNLLYKFLPLILVLVLIVACIGIVKAFYNKKIKSK